MAFDKAGEPPSVLRTISKEIEDDPNGRLRDRLRALGFSDVSARKFDVPGENKPDGAWTFSYSDAVPRLAIFSGKMGTKKRTSQAISTAWRYRQTIGKVEPVAEAFGVTFADKGEQFGLYALESDRHPFESHLVDSLDHLAQRIKEILDQKQPPPEHSETLMVRLLRSAVDQVSSAFTKSSAKQLSPVLGADSPLVSSLITLPSSTQASEAAARSAAAYLLVNQVLFYYILASHPELKLPRIDPERLNPLALRPIYFSKVLEVDYKPVFEFDVAKHLERKAGSQALRSVLHAFEQVRADQIGNDVIGKVFHNLIPLERRKPLGAYYTNSNAADLMAALTVQKSFDKVLDPACGSGTMLVSGYRAKAALQLASGRTVTPEVHERFVGEHLTGIDIMPFSAHLAVVNLSLQAPRYQLEKVRAAIHDSLQLKPGNRVESSREVFRRAARFGMRRLEAFDKSSRPETLEGGIAGGFELQTVDVVLMNPPFSDSERIPRDYKDDLETRFASTRTKDLLTGKYSLQLPFLLLADEFLVDGGRLGAVLPTTTLTGEAYAPWLEWFLTQYTVKAIVVGLGRSAFSENTAISECLLIAEKTPPQREAAQFVLVGTEISPQQWDEAFIHEATDLAKSQAAKVSPGRLVSQVFDQARLGPRGDGLQALLQQLSPEWAEGERALSRLLISNAVSLKKLEETGAIRIRIDPLSTREQPGPHGRGREYYCAAALSYYSASAHLARRDDRFLVIKSDSISTVVQDRVTGDSFTVPTPKLVPLARSMSRIKRLDCSPELDYIAGSWFKGLERIIRHVIKTDPEISALGDPTSLEGVFASRIKRRWDERCAAGRTAALLVRKVNLAASGTCLVASYSETRPMVAGSYWLVDAPDGETWREKAIVLWLNSSFFLAQLMSARTQTGGTWGRIDKHRLSRVLAPDFRKFSARERRNVVDLFDRLSSVEFPSLVQQLETDDSHRAEIDRFFASVLKGGVVDSKSESDLALIKTVLLAKIRKLREAMR